MAWCSIKAQGNLTFTFKVENKRKHVQQNRDSSVGVVTGYKLMIERSGFESRRGLGIFLFTAASRPALVSTQPPIQGVPWALSLEITRPGCEFDHSSLSTAEAKNAWSYTSTPQYAFMAWCLVKHKDNFIFTLPVRQEGI
jgi:hypothetical protein